MRKVVQQLRKPGFSADFLSKPCAQDLRGAMPTMVDETEVSAFFAWFCLDGTTQIRKVKAEA